MSDELASLDATAQADLVRRRQVSAAELTDAAIARIERLNPTLNAVIHAFFERARAEAKAPADGGPFAGVPFLMKDLMCYTAGDPMHMGTRFLRDADFRTPHDSYLAQKFRRTGVVYLGRTNTPELGTRPGTESLGHEPLDRRIERRLCGRRGGGHGADRARERRRRLDPHPGQRMRPRRAQALARPHVVRARSRRRRVRPRRRRHRLALG